MSTRDPAADEAFAGIAAERVRSTGCTVRRMFGSNGLFAGDRLAAFVSGSGNLVVKLPPDLYRSVAEGTTAEPMVMRGSPMREWLAVPLGATDWAHLVDAAIGYVRD